MHVCLVAAKMPEMAPEDRLIDVRIGKHDVGRFAAELHGRVLEVPGRLLVDDAPRGVGAGEADLAHQRMLDERSADFAAKTGDDIEHPRRKPRLVEQLGELERGRRGEFRWLDDVVQSAASAGAIFQLANISGEFHGVMAATTPRGSSRVKLQ